MAESTDADQPTGDGQPAKKRATRKSAAAQSTSKPTAGKSKRTTKATAKTTTPVTTDPEVTIAPTVELDPAPESVPTKTAKTPRKRTTKVKTADPGETNSEVVLDAESAESPSPTSNGAKPAQEPKERERRSNPRQATPRKAAAATKATPKESIPKSEEVKLEIIGGLVDELTSPHQHWPETPNPEPETAGSTITSGSAELAPDASAAASSEFPEAGLSASEDTSEQNATTSIKLYIAAIALVAFAVGLSAGVVIGALASNESASETLEALPSQAIAPNQPTAGVDQPAAPSPNPPAPAPASAEGQPAGAQLAQLGGGAGSRQSSPFALPGGPIKVRYQGDGSGLTVRLLQEGGSDGDSFYCPGPCSREAALEKAGGSYYLNIDAREGNWTVEVLK